MQKMSAAICCLGDQKMQSLVYVIIAKVRKWGNFTFCSGPPANLVPIEDICLFFSFSISQNNKKMTQKNKCTILPFNVKMGFWNVELSTEVRCDSAGAPHYCWKPFIHPVFWFLCFLRIYFWTFCGSLAGWHLDGWIHSWDGSGLTKTSLVLGI